MVTFLFFLDINEQVSPFRVLGAGVSEHVSQLVEGVFTTIIYLCHWADLKSCLVCYTFWSES